MALAPTCTCFKFGDIGYPCALHGDATQHLQPSRRRYDHNTDLAEIGGLRLKPQTPLPEPQRIAGLYAITLEFLRYLTPDQLKTIQDAVMSITNSDARK